MSTQNNPTTTLIFVYGTLKRGFPNHHLIESLTTTNDAKFIATATTVTPYPLVLGPLGIPFLINLPGSGHRVKGELYSVSSRALARLDELEGVSRGHYERLPLEVNIMMESGLGQRAKDGPGPGPDPVILNELDQGVAHGHYERLPLEVETGPGNRAEGGPDGVMGRAEARLDNGGVVLAEGYFGDRSFGEDMWVKSGKIGMEEYKDKDGEMYVRIKDRDVGLNLKDYIMKFLKCDGVN